MVDNYRKSQSATAAYTAAGAFTKCGPMFIILNSTVIQRVIILKTSHNLNVSLHYLVKYIAPF